MLINGKGEYLRSVVLHPCQLIGNAVSISLGTRASGSQFCSLDVAKEMAVLVNRHRHENGPFQPIEID